MQRIDIADVTQSDSKLSMNPPCSRFTHQINLSSYIARSYAVRVLAIMSYQYCAFDIYSLCCEPLFPREAGHSVDETSLCPTTLTPQVGRPRPYWIHRSATSFAPELIVASVRYQWDEEDPGASACSIPMLSRFSYQLPACQAVSES
jgi:hypothetical protein